MSLSGGKPLLIVGGGEIAALACEYFRHDSDFMPVAFAVERPYRTSDTFQGLPLVDLDEVTQRFPPGQVDAFVAVGDTQLNRLRRRLYDTIKRHNYRVASYVSSQCFRWHNVEIGENCFILEHNTLQPFVKIKNNVTLWSGNHIGHSTTIHENVFITSHVVISGFCEIEKSSYIGVNASLAHHVTIASDNFIAMGSVIGASTEPDGVYQGNPAERRKVAATRFCRVKES
ncbi:sugar O-acyltransferase, sialic acid O-acetyltransferase NeuD family [Methylobacterium phyllostachyos]|uniref:Sugar O-acyltransferase, sialic acid O-acetyltransferase NeuD family n=1 Tax=Methylobacterium phyllostachyos TaxID=582672 RepID=A0A1H0KBY9_9HYPH|nr:acetyltransferase [Methylobacterium phyllostachyos]SDO53475.1 sugar O-acyltransferase, sialic acid O-acetyltransferase NeuD family [Methylobacterium phyllostachyos]